MRNQRQWIVLSGLLSLTLLTLTGCNPTASTSTAGATLNNRGRTADAQQSDITATNLTQTTPSSVTVTLRSKGGAPLLGVVPSISVEPLTSDDFNFQCGASNASGVAMCSFRSFDTSQAKRVVLTSPVSKAGNMVTVSQAAGQISIATQPTSGLAAGAANTVVVRVLDPKGVLVLGDNSTVVSPSLVVAQNTNVIGVVPSLRRGVTTCTPATNCGVTVSAGEAQFAAGNSLNVTTSGTYSISFAAPGVTAGVTNQISVVGGTATQTVFTTSPTTAVAPLEIFPQQPIVKVADAAGNLVSTGACATAVLEVSLVGGLGAGSVLGTVAEAASGGVASFADNGLRIDRTPSASNIYRLSAVDNPICGGAALTAGQSANFTVSDVGISNKLAFGTQPSTVTTTGTALLVQPTVRVLDNANSLVTSNNTASVTLNAGGCPGVTIGGTTTRTVVNGVATFNDITLSTASPPRNCQLGATSAGLTSALSANVRVEAAGLVPAKLAWLAQPTATGKGQNILAAGPAALTVRVLDSGNNLVAVDNATRVSITHLPATGALTGTVTQQVVNGVATFSDLKLSANGAFTLTAAAAGLTSATSNAFVINNSGVATALKISSDDLLTVNNAVAFPFAGPADGDPDYFPNSITAGVKFERGPIVQVVDENGALVPTASGQQVTLACTSPAGCVLRGFPLQVFAVNGIADFHVGGGHSLRIDSPMGNNIVLTATATGLVAGSTPSPIVGSPATPSAATSSIAALCPSAVGVPDGTIFFFSKDQFANPHVGAAVTIGLSGGCTSVCGTTDSTGRASCAFSCPAAGTITAGGTQAGVPQIAVTPVGAGAPTLLSISATCGF